MGTISKSSVTAIGFSSREDVQAEIERIFAEFYKRPQKISLLLRYEPDCKLARKFTLPVFEGFSISDMNLYLLALPVVLKTVMKQAEELISKIPHLSPGDGFFQKEEHGLAFAILEKIRDYLSK